MSAPESVAHHVPNSLSSSRLYASGGVVRLSGLLTEPALVALETEATASRPTGVRNVLIDVAPNGSMEERGGCPRRSFTAADGGVVQWTIFTAPAFVAGVEERCGLAVAPTGGGSYSYYEQPGDFLALHRDVARCDLTVITCVRSSRAAAGPGGALLVYSDLMDALLADVQRAGRAAATVLPMDRGDTVALLGGMVPHEVTEMQFPQERVVSVMCYRVLINGTPLS
jgi:hypothetical protein